MRSFTPVALIAILLLAPVGLGQVPPAPTPVLTVTIQNPPAEFTGLDEPNATVVATFDVLVQLSNVVCTEAATIPVTVAVSAAGPPGFFTVAPEPELVNISISQGPHGNPPVGEPGGGTATGGVRATIAGNITANASVPVTITASASAPAVCQGAGSASPATSEPVTIFANMTAPPPPPAEEPTPEDTPFLGFVAVAAVAVGVALLRRKKA